MEVKRRGNRASLFIFVLLIAALLYYSFTSSSGNKISYQKLRELFDNGDIATFSVKDDTLYATEQDGTSVKCELPDFAVFYNEMDSIVQEQVASGVITSYDYTANHSTNWMQILLPYIAIILGFFLLMNLMTRMTGNPMNDKMAKFGEARVEGVPSGNQRVTFDDVAGADEEKGELEEIVKFLSDPERFLDLGAHIPKGVLLVGPPGTGKTLLAKAVAGEAGVQFLSISGSDFVEMYVGVGASRVRDLFEKAKKSAPAIVFIDEIDAVGRQRGSGLGGGHDEREQTLNQLLVEMDGFSANSGVVVLAATNRVDILDPALLRPGRFDRRVYVGLPDIKGREEILKIHARNKPLAEDVDLKKAAQGTPGFTGADLENLLNEAALLTGRRGQNVISQSAIDDSIIKVIAGPEKHSRVVPETERKLTAFHEAGHAIVMHELPNHDPVHSISIVPRGQAGGMTISLPDEDRSYLSRNYMLDQIVALLGGRAAEEIALGDISTGASNDIQRATSMARKMVGSYGMSTKIGTVAFDAGSDEVFIGKSMTQTRHYSDQTAAEIDEEIKTIVNESYDKAKRILEEQRVHLSNVANYLLEHETMSAEEFEKTLSE